MHLLLGTSGISNFYTGLVAGLSKKEIFFYPTAPRFLNEHCFWKFPRIRNHPPLQRPGFDPRSAHVRFGADKVALGKVFLPVLRFSPVSIIPQSLSIHLHLRVAFTRRTNGWNRGTFQKAVLCSIISLLYASTCFEHYVLIIRRSKLYYTASGIITPVGGHPVHRLRADWTSPLSTCAWDGHLQVWWYQMLYNTILTSWWWAHSARNM